MTTNARARRARVTGPDELLSAAVGPVAPAPRGASVSPELEAAQRAAGLPACPLDERLAAASEDGQALYRVLLRSLVAGSGLPPVSEAGASVELGEDRARAALAALAAAELVAVDRDGAVVGLFPLSAVPTRHVVHLSDGRQLHAMCAVDALGVPAMLRQPATVVSTEPGTGRTVRVLVPADAAPGDPGERAPGAPTIVVDPPEAVVLLARAGTGARASACCSVLDVYADAPAAKAALDGRGMAGAVLPVADAHALGVELFGRLPAR